MRISRGAAMAVVVLLLGGCAWGVTGTATRIHDTSAEVNGVVHNSAAVTTEYWFEYGTSTDYGSETPHRTDMLYGNPATLPTAADLHGLPEDTLFHYRLCAQGPVGTTSCGADMTFTTTINRDSVTGGGSVYSDPQLGYSVSASVDGSSGPDGAAPVDGSAASSPGTLYFRIADHGSLTCMRVSGNRAVVGFVYDGSDIGVSASVPRTIFIEDNGPTGDLLAFGVLAEPYTTCPDPASATFPPITIGGPFQIPPVLASGDFVVEDNPNS